MNRITHILVLVVAASISLVATSASPARGQEAADFEPVKAGREALDRYSDYPWYDAERDQIRRFDVEPPTDVAGRRSKWEPKPVNWSFPDWLGSLFEGLLWAIAILTLLVLIYALYQALLRADLVGGPSRSDDDEGSLHGDIDRVEALPFALARPQSDLLSEARRQYEEGNYNQAMIYLYSYQLVQLDRHQLIRLTKGKTNRQYLRELRSQPDLYKVLRGSMIAFEDVFFGHHVLSKLHFESHWQELGTFHQQLEPMAVA